MPMQTKLVTLGGNVLPDYHAGAHRGWLSLPLTATTACPQAEEFLAEFVPLPSRLAQSETAEICENESDRGVPWWIFSQKTNR